MTIYNTGSDIAILLGLTVACFVDVMSGASFLMQREYLAAEWYVETKRYTKITKRLPSWLFGVVWTILYILVIASLYILFRAAIANSLFDRTLDIIGVGSLVNIFLNKIWTPVFFTLHMPWAAFFIVVALNALNGLIWAYMWIGGYHDSFWIYLFYVAWCFFALILNAEWLWAESKMKRKKGCPPEQVEV